MTEQSASAAVALETSCVIDDAPVCWIADFAEERWARHVRSVAYNRKSWVRSLWAQLVSGAACAGHPLEVSFDQAVDLIERSAGRCAVSGICFSTDIFGRSGIAPFRPTFDRIDPQRGFGADNLALVCAYVNDALSRASNGGLRKIAVPWIARRMQASCEACAVLYGE